MIRQPLSRRTLLRGAGGLALGLPLLEAMTPRKARADGQTAPKRLVTWFTPNGNLHDLWVPSGSTTDFNLGPILQPLAMYQSDLNVIDGLNMTRGTIGDGHQQGMSHLWTNIELLPGDVKGGCDSCPAAGFSSGPSIDQFIAKKVGLQGNPSITLGVQTQGKDAWTRMSYSGSNAPVDPITDPWQLFQNLFANLPTDNASRVAFLKLQAERKTVVDSVLASYTSLKPKLSGDDQQRVAAHLQAVQDLQKQVEAAAPPIDSCTKPTLMDKGKFNIFDNDNYPAVGKMMMDLLATALACNLTTVGSIQWHRSVSQIMFTWIGVSGEGNEHHALSHRDTESAVIPVLQKINTWYAQQFAYLVAALKAMPEGSGTVLDNTLLVWGNELADGTQHSEKPAFFVTAGKCGGAVKTGRFLQYKGDPHGNLLVSIANAMGVQTNTFGNPDWCKGPLANF